MLGVLAVRSVFRLDPFISYGSGGRALWSGVEKGERVTGGIWGGGVVDRYGWWGPMGTW